MALFTKKATATAEPKKEVSTEVRATSGKSTSGLDLAMVLVRPHVTEKATDLSERNVYAFEINALANKMHVRQAVEKFYKVKPLRIAVVNIHAKYERNPRTGRTQVKKPGLKKALVYLKKDDKLEFV